MVTEEQNRETIITKKEGKQSSLQIYVCLKRLEVKPLTLSVCGSSFF